MSDMLSIGVSPTFDNSISKYEFHTYTPSNESFGPNDSIIISIQQQNLNILPSDSFLYIEGTIEKTDNTVIPIVLANNGVSFLFEEIRYELNGVEIDKTRKLGHTTTIKNYLSMNSDESKMMRNAGWSTENINITNGKFNFCVPLRNILGFAEDYRKIVLNARHDLIITRSKTDDNFCILTKIGTEEIPNVRVKLTKIQWKVPHVNLSDNEKLVLYKTMKAEKSVCLSYRSWDMHEYPILPETEHHIWTVKTSSQLEKPRFIIIALQTDRIDSKAKDPSRFDHCGLTNIKVHLNSNTYPYDSLNLKFSLDRYALLYYMYANFQKRYYKRENSPLLTWSDFKSTAPIAVIDCSHQDEVIKTGPVDIKVEFETEAKMPPKTSAFCLLIHDRIIEYNMFTNEVKKII